jgi:hypothetical protein
MQYDPTTAMPAKSPAGDIAKWIDGVKSEKKCRHIDRSGADLQRQGLGLRDGARCLRREVG